MAKYYGGGPGAGGSLPAVTPVDAGDILQVSSIGAWQKASNTLLSFATIALRNAYTGLRSEGMIVYVRATKCWYSLAPDLTTWDFFTSNQAELATQATWFVSTTGSNNNDGATALTALQTTDELEQRLCPYGAKYRPQQATTITIGAGTFNNLQLNVENTLNGTGIDLIAIVGTMSAGAAITLSASVTEVPGTQTRGEITGPGTFVAQRRIKVTSGAQTNSIGYSTGLHTGVTNTWTSNFINYATGSQNFPAINDNVVQDTFSTTIRNLSINYFGLNNNFIRVQDVALSQSCTLNDYTNTIGATTGSSLFLFGDSLSNGLYLDSNIGAILSGCVVPSGASVRIRSGNWGTTGGVLQGKLFVYPNAGLDVLDSAYTLDGGNIIIGGTSSSHQIGPSSFRIGGNLQLCNGTATSAIKLSPCTAGACGVFIWSGTTPGGSYTNMVELDPGSDFISAVGFASYTAAATNKFLVGGVGYPAQQILAPQLSCSVTQYPEPSPINGSTYLINQTNNIAPTNLFSANGRAGNYIFTAYVSVTTVGTVGIPVVNAIFTDDSGVSRTVPAATGASIAGLNGAGGIACIELSGNSNVQFSVTGIITPGTLKYSVRVDCRLQSDN